MSRQTAEARILDAADMYGDRDGELTDGRRAELLRRAESKLETASPSVPYPIDALGPLADVARAIAQGGQVREAMAGQAVLATAALLTQSIADVETLDGRRPLSLYAMTVADSGDGKTAAERVALAPVKAWQRAASRRYRAELADFEATPPKERGDAPRAPYRIAKDATVEGIRLGYTAGTPTQGVFTSEAAAMLCGFGMSADHRMKTAGTLNGLWDDGEVSVSRGTAGRIQLYDRRLSAHWLIQPSAVRETMYDSALSDIGLWPRFLVAWPDPPAPRLYRHFDPDADPAVAAYFARATELLGDTVTEDCGGLPLIQLSNDARSLAGRFFERMEEAARGGGLTDVKPFALRATEQACRIAGVLAAFGDEQVVDAELMRCGLALATYSVETWRGIFGDREQASASRHAAKVYAWLLKQPQATAKVQDLLHVGPKPRSRSNRDSALATLAGLGLVHRTGDNVRAAT